GLPGTPLIAGHAARPARRQVSRRRREQPYDGALTRGSTYEFRATVGMLPRWSDTSAMALTEAFAARFVG
ncbi:MAG: hypothetical protein QOH50_255, partial [Kribbellaceae bacterium]|nr:hypothetical protein [Kribbellaceae bacterium]